MSILGMFTPMLMLVIKILAPFLITAIVLLYFWPRMVDAMPSSIRRRVEKGFAADLKFTFLPGVYEICGGLGSGKSYSGTMMAAKLASHFKVPLITNYDLKPQLYYGLRHEGYTDEPVKQDPKKVHVGVEHRLVKFQDPENPDWMIGAGTRKAPNEVTSVYVLDEVLYNIEMGHVRKLLAAQMLHARKRGQIIFLISQSPLTGKFKRVIRFRLQCSYWFPFRLFLVGLIDPKTNQRSRFSKIKTYKFMLNKWFAQAYETCEDFDDSALEQISDERMRNDEISEALAAF